MRARHRHFNPAHAGAVSVLDSRYINQANNSAVSTWEDRSNNNYDAAQATGANQPVFRYNVQAGNPAVEFVGGSTDFMEFATFASLTDFTFIVTAIVNSNQDVAIIEANNGTSRRGLSWGSTGTGVGPLVVYGANRFRTTTSSQLAAWKIFESDSGPTVRVNESSLSLSAELTGTAGTSNLRRLGRLAFNVNQYLDGQLAQVFAFDSNLSDSTRKRVSHHAAYSFKIACN
jgi:hypothetical protein